MHCTIGNSFQTMNRARAQTECACSGGSEYWRVGTHSEFQVKGHQRSVDYQQQQIYLVFDFEEVCNHLNADECVNNTMGQ